MYSDVWTENNINEIVKRQQQKSKCDQNRDPVCMSMTLRQEKLFRVYVVVMLTSDSSIPNTMLLIEVKDPSIHN